MSQLRCVGIECIRTRAQCTEICVGVVCSGAVFGVVVYLNVSAVVAVVVVAF